MARAPLSPNKDTTPITVRLPAVCKKLGSLKKTTQGKRSATDDTRLKKTTAIQFSTMGISVRSEVKHG
jgi:hypothetical protein